jgi:hypothetical protein
MNAWIRRALVVLEVGGGFTGIVFLTAARPWAREPHGGWWLPFGLYAGLFLFAVMAGVLLAEGTRRGIKWSAICQALQVPVVVSSIVTCRFVCGLQITVGSCAGNWVVEGGIGATSFFSIGQAVSVGPHMSGPGFGINVAAACIFLYLLWQLRKMPVKQALSGTPGTLATDSAGGEADPGAEKEWFCPAVQTRIEQGLCWEYCFAGEGGPTDAVGDLDRWIEESPRLSSLEEFHSVCRTCAHRQWSR